MSTIDLIDPDRRMKVSGSVTSDLSSKPDHPLHEAAMNLAKQTSNPALLRHAELIEGTAFEIPAGPFLNWLKAEPRWALEFSEDLQCIAETAAGEKLLSTWLSADRFWSLLEECGGVDAIDAIAAHVRAWRGLGLDEVYFDFHVLGSPTAVAEAFEMKAEPDLLKGSVMAQLEVTPWFENGEKPSHTGPYERKGFGETCFTYWGGEHFGYIGKTPEAAVQIWKESNGRKSFHQHRAWRGVKPDDRPAA